MPKPDAMQAALEKEKAVNEQRYHGITLSTEQKNDLICKIKKDIEDDQAARKEYLDKVVDVLDKYEGKITQTPSYTGEFLASSRVVTMVVETLHSILYPTIWNEDLQYWQPVGKEDIETSEAVNKFMAWDAKYTKMIQFVDDWCKRIILEGTVITKTRWVTEFKWVQVKTPKLQAIGKKVMRTIKNVLTGRNVDFEITDQDYNISYEPRKVEYCVTDLIPLEDVGFPVYNSNRTKVNKLDHIWHRTRPYIYEIDAMEAQGLYEAGSTLKVSEAIEKLIMDQQATSKQRMDAEGSTNISHCKAATPASVVEWYGMCEMDGKWHDIVVWFEEKSETILAATHLRNINKYSNRPFSIAQLIPRPGRMYGMSIGEIVKEHQRTLDEMLNININAAKMGVNPPGFYRAASGFDPEKIFLQPGIMIPVDDINDAVWKTIPNNILPTSAEMKFILELVQQIVGIGSYQSGQESSVTRTRSTARGTLALISQGERRFNVLGKRLQYHIAEVMKSKLEYYQQFLPPAFAERILGSDGAVLFPDGLDNSDLAGEYDLFLTLDSTGGSKSLKVENAVQMYGAYMGNPLVQQDPARMWEVSARPLIEAGEINVERYLGPKPPSLEEQAQQAGMTPQQFQQAQMMQAQATAAAQAPPSSSPTQPSPESGAAPANPQGA